MNTNDYIKELKSHLSVLDKGKREEIIKEIESYVLESEATYSLLVERFGEPKELASGYLEDIVVEEQESTTLKKTKRAFLTIFIFLVVAFVGIALVIYFMTRDDFDYSKYDASSVSKKLEEPWMEIKDISKLDIAQSKIIIYWNMEAKTKISCKKDDEEDEKYKAENKRELKNDTLFIKQSSCVLSLPKQSYDIKIYQAKVILVRPNDTVSLDSEQSTINIVDDQNRYSYDFEGKQSDIDEFSSNPNGIAIKGKFYQSNVKSYEN